MRDRYSWLDFDYSGLDERIKRYCATLASLGSKARFVLNEPLRQGQNIIALHMPFLTLDLTIF